MDNPKRQNKNSLVLYRRRMRLSQKAVSKLLGHKDSTTLSKYESGELLPPFKVALGLGVILRVPVEFLFPVVYDALKDRIREQEENQRKSRKESLTDRR